MSGERTEVASSIAQEDRPTIHFHWTSLAKANAFCSKVTTLNFETFGRALNRARARSTCEDLPEFSTHEQNGHNSKNPASYQEER